MLSTANNIHAEKDAFKDLVEEAVGPPRCSNDKMRARGASALVARKKNNLFGKDDEGAHHQAIFEI